MVEPFVRSGRLPRRRLLDGLPSRTVQEDMAPSDRYPLVVGNKIAVVIRDN